MKKITKLVVLLLTLALLLGSVFAVTAFAADPEVATATSETEDVIFDLANGLGGASPNTAGGGTYNKGGRFGTGTYRDYKLENGVLKAWNRIPAEGETMESTLRQFQYTFNNNNLKTDAQYLVYEFKVGTDSTFFHKADGTPISWITIGGWGSSSINGATVYFYQDADGNAWLNTKDTATSTFISLGKIDTTDGIWYSPTITAVMQPDWTDTTKSTLHFFVDGNYAGKFGGTINAFGNGGGRAQFLVATDSNSENQTMYFKDVAFSAVNDSTTAEGDLAYVFNTFKNSTYTSRAYTGEGAFDGLLGEWSKRSDLYTYAPSDAAIAGATEGDKVGVMIGIDGAPLCAQFNAADLRNVFAQGNDVTLTLLEDLTFTHKFQNAQGASAQYNGFTITTAGTKTFNLNGHTFSHLPLTNGNDGGDVYLPTRGQTFVISAADIDLVINGANANGDMGKIFKQSSANDLFKHTAKNLVSNITVNDTVIDVAGGSTIFGNYSRSSTDSTKNEYYGSLMNAYFTNVKFDLKAAPTNYEGTSGTPSIKFEGLRALNGLAETRAEFIFTDCDFGKSVLVGALYSDVEISYTAGKNVNNDIILYASSKDTKFTNASVTIDGAELNGGYDSNDKKIPLLFTATDSDLIFKNCDMYLGGYTVTNAKDSARKTFKFVNCNLSTSGSKAKYASYVDVDYVDCDIRVYSVISEAALLNGEQTNTIDYYNCSVNYVEGATYYALVGTDQSTVTLHEGCRVDAKGKSMFNGYVQKLADGCYLADNDGEDKDVYPYVVKEFDFNLLNAMANLTLYTDINYNLYVPTQGVDAYISAINGTPLAELETITDAKTGVEYYVVTTPIAIHEADKSVDFELTLSSALLKNKKNLVMGEFKKTLSVGDYIKRVYADAKYSSSYTLMSDLVDYADAAIKYFGGSAENAFAAFKTNDNYAPTELEAVPATTTSKDGLSGYISGSTLNLEKSNVKFLFTVAQAGEYTVSYESADGKTVTSTKTYAEGENIEVAMRAYDLNAAITITCGNATGSYDLAAYAADVKNVDADAYALVLEMYNYAVSAKAYKFGN